MHSQQLVNLKPKVQTIIDLGIIEFYDDSPHHIIDLQQSRDQLPADFKLFLSE